MFFFLQGPAEERWKRLRHRDSVRFPKYSSVTLRAKTYSALSFDVFNMSNICFNFLGNPLLYVIVFVSQQKLFVDACQMTVKSRALHLISGPPNWRKPYNKNLISLGPYCKLRILCQFFNLHYCTNDVNYIISTSIFQLVPGSWL